MLMHVTNNRLELETNCNQFRNAIDLTIAHKVSSHIFPANYLKSITDDILSELPQGVELIYSDKSLF